jgi:hypothetical protein
MFSSSCLNFCDVKCVGTGSQTVQRTSLASSLPPSLSFLPEAQPARAVVGIQLQVLMLSCTSSNSVIKKSESCNTLA